MGRVFLPRLSKSRSLDQSGQDQLGRDASGYFLPTIANDNIRDIAPQDLLIPGDVVPGSAESVAQTAPKIGPLHPGWLLNNKPLRRALRTAIWHILLWRTREISTTDLYQSTVVIAPHPDDECLGCGGTILRLKQAGVKVAIVFLTDGGASHRHFMPRDKMAARRTHEAIAAARTYGLSATDVHFIDIEDGALELHQEEAQQLIRDILSTRRPGQVLIPYWGERHRDHVAANKIVQTSVAMLDDKPVVREYPVWFWKNWPWMANDRTGLIPRLHFFLRSVRDLGRLLRDFDNAVDIRQNLAGKSAALACHASQVNRPEGYAHWNTLQEIGGGDWLSCFFMGFEFYHSPRDKKPSRTP